MLQFHHRGVQPSFLLYLNLGLGLNIVKNLVELHDGEIVASNRIDKEGAMIEIRFPNV